MSRFRSSGRYRTHHLNRRCLAKFASLPSAGIGEPEGDSGYSVGAIASQFG